MTAVPWQEAATTIPVALAVSSVSLLYRFRRKGHPFRSTRARSWAVAVIVVAAAPTGVALFVPRVPPAYLGMVAPALLATRDGRQRRQPEDPEYDWHQVVHLFRLMLDQLEAQMETDRDQWCKEQISRVTAMEEVKSAAEELYELACNRSSMRAHVKRMKSHYDKVAEVGDAHKVADLRNDAKAAGRAEHEARRALSAMLRLVYDNCPVRDDIIPWRSSSAPDMSH